MASTYLTRTPSSAGNRKVFTFSAWIKSSGLSGDRTLFSAGVSPRLSLQINSNNEIKTDIAGIGAYNESNNVLRDTSGWYHVVWKFDTTQATANDRSIIYVNGEAIDDKNTRTFSQNTDYPINTTEIHRIGALTNVLTHYFDGSMAHVHFIDGTAYDASAFGQTDSTTGQWKPKVSPSVTYGTNGFFLKFASSGSMGTDSSGNGNNFTVSGSLTQTQDTPSNNFATMNPLSNTNSSYTFGNLNNKVASSTQWLNSNSTLGMIKGKWYWEVKYISGNFGIGIGQVGNGATSTKDNSSANLGYAGKYSRGYEFFRNGDNAQKINNNTSSSYGTAPSANDIFMVAFDADNGAIWIGRQGTWFNSATSSEIAAGTTTNAMYSSLNMDDSYLCTASIESGELQFNFGNGYFGTTAVSSANSDDAGLGLFEYAPPTGYYSLCTKNINTYG